MRWNGTSRCEFDGKSVESGTWSEFPNGGKAIVEQILASEEINKSKRAGLWESVWNPSMKVHYLSKVIWNRKIITEFTRWISSTRIGKPVLIMDVKVSKDKNISSWVDWENFIFMLRWKRSKTLSEKRSVENIIKNLQSFLQIGPCKKKSFFNTNCKTMHMSTRILSD